MFDWGAVARYHSAMNSPPRQDKFRAYRARKKAAGLREVRMWVPDMTVPEFQKELDRTIEKINAMDRRSDIMDWIEAAAAETWGAPD